MAVKLAVDVQLQTCQGVSDVLFVISLGLVVGSAAMGHYMGTVAFGLLAVNAFVLSALTTALLDACGSPTNRTRG